MYPVLDADRKKAYCHASKVAKKQAPELGLACELEESGIGPKCACAAVCSRGKEERRRFPGVMSDCLAHCSGKDR